jgi:hypothetical protein
MKKIDVSASRGPCIAWIKPKIAEKNQHAFECCKNQSTYILYMVIWPYITQTHNVTHSTKIATIYTEKW